MVNIASDMGAANNAVTGVQSVSVNKGQQVSLGKSNITSMTNGAQVTNLLLTDFAKLIDCVKEQSQKFPKIAEVMAIEDSKVKF